MISHPLINYLIEEYGEKLKMNPQQKSIKVTDDCLNLLMNYNWEGNVRELKNLIKNIIVKRLIGKNRQDIECSDLPQHILEPVVFEKIGSKPKKGRKKRPSDEVLIRLKNDGWKPSKVAREFGVVRETASRWYTSIRNQQSQQNQ